MLTYNNYNKNQCFKKKERLHSKKLISLLLKHGTLIQNNSLLKIRYLFIEKKSNNVNNQILIIVPRKNIKRAVDRNKIRRHIREIYRQNKDIFCVKKDKTLLLSFTYIPKIIYNFIEIKKCILEEAKNVV